MITSYINKGIYNMFSLELLSNTDSTRRQCPPRCSKSSEGCIWSYKFPTTPMEYYKKYTGWYRSSSCDGNWIWQVPLFPISKHIQDRNNFVHQPPDFINPRSNGEIEPCWYQSWIPWFCSNSTYKNLEASREWFIENVIHHT